MTTTTREAALPLTDAPKDHTLLWLLVDYSGDGANPLEDEILGWTIGHNGFDHTGVDEWEFAGWSWEQDCFTQGVGNVVGWYPLQRPDQQPATPATEPQGYVDELIEKLRAGVVQCGLHEDNSTELFDIEDANETMFEAAQALAARPAPQPAAGHEYPDPLIAEDRYEDDQPAADTRVVTDAMIVEIWKRAQQYDPDELFIELVRAIIGTATPSPSDKIAEAGRERMARALREYQMQGRITVDWDKVPKSQRKKWFDLADAALRALAGKGETP